MVDFGHLDVDSFHPSCVFVLCVCSVQYGRSVCCMDSCVSFWMVVFVATHGRVWIRHVFFQSFVFLWLCDLILVDERARV